MNTPVRTAKLASWQIWTLSLSGLALWLSGIGWLWLHHYGQVAGPFGPETNPLEPWFLRAHGLVLIPALLAIGGLFVAHFSVGWQFKRQRVLGLILAIATGALIISGYLLYYVGDDTARDWTSISHWVIGLPVPIVFVWHYLGRRKAKQK